MDERRSVLYILMFGAIVGSFYYIPSLGGFTSENFFLAISLPSAVLAFDFIITSAFNKARERIVEYRERFRK